MLTQEKLWNKKFAGDLLVADPEVIVREVEPGDEFVIIACDGLWDVMSSEQVCMHTCACRPCTAVSHTALCCVVQVVNFVRRELAQHHNAAKAAHHLTKKALELRSIDNVSAIVVCLHQS